MPYSGRVLCRGSVTVDLCHAAHFLPLKAMFRTGHSDAGVLVLISPIAQGLILRRGQKFTYRKLFPIFVVCSI
jgi:hypothetical protein